MSRRFSCETHLVPALIFIAGLSVFLLIGILVYSSGESTMGLFMIVVTSSFIVIIAATAVPFPAYYELDENELILRNRIFTTTIPYDDLAGIRVVEDGEAKGLLSGLQQRFLDAERNRDTEKWRVTGRALREFTRFSTVPVVHGTSSPAIWLKTLSPESHASTSYVLIERNDQPDLLVTPKDRHGFVEAVESHLTGQ